MRLLLLTALFLVGPAPLVAAQYALPTSGIVKGAGQPYGVRGRHRIPHGKKLVLQQGVRIVAMPGADGADCVIEVAGSLVVHGQAGLEIRFEGVAVQPVGAFDQIKLEWVVVDGGAGLVTAPETSASGDVVLANTFFLGTAGVDVSFTKGNLRFEQFDADSWVHVEGVPMEDEEPEPGETFVSPVEFQAGGCRFKDGLKLEALSKGVVRNSRLGGPASEFKNCDELQLTDCRFESKALELRHGDARTLSKSKLARCDVYSESVLLGAPAPSGKPRKLEFEGFWFQDAITEEAVAERITDHADDSGVGVVAKLKDLREEPRFK